MLRISLTRHCDATTMKLEGKLLAPWCDEVQTALERAARDSGALRIDLSDLTFIDDAGTQLIRQLLGRGVVLASCSNFVAELLHAE